jgi:hypothetical protein
MTRTFVQRGQIAMNGRAGLPITVGIGVGLAPCGWVRLHGEPQVKETTMIPRDIYDDMPNGTTQRQTNKRRLAELERDGVARRARLAQLIALEELWHEVVQAHTKHVL